MLGVLVTAKAAAVLRVTVLAAAVLTASCALPAASTGAQAGSCPTTPTLAFASSAPIRVPVGAGGVYAPFLTVDCDGAPLANAYVGLTLVPGNTGVSFGQLSGQEDEVVGNAQGEVAPPVITSALTTGGFSLDVEVDGATASLAGEVVGRLKGILPPRNPAYGLSIEEHTQPTCAGVHDYSAVCLDESVALLNAGRRSEHLGPLLLPANWQRLTVPEQLFMMTDLERTARGLPPDSGLARDWDAAAAAGAEAGTDPRSAGAGAHGFESIWAGGAPNPIDAMLGLIYNDGLYRDGSTQDIDCSRSDPSGCWGHRVIELHDTAAISCEALCVVGAAYSPKGFDGHASYAEVFGAYSGNNADRPVFLWLAELPQLPACERSGDTCGWKDRPILTAKGFTNVRGFPAGESPPIRPWFRVRIGGGVSGSGLVNLSVSVGYRLAGITALASRGGEHRTLRVSRLSTYSFRVAGSLSPGRWTVTIRYRTPRAYGAEPSSRLRLTVPNPL
jgi:hypothetical protein